MKKQYFKKVLALICTAVLACGALSACGDGTNDTAGESTEAVEENTSMGAVAGGVEGEAVNGQVDKIVTTLMSTTFDTSPFQPPSPGSVLRPFMYATLIHPLYAGALLEDCEMWLAKSVTRVDEYTYDIELYDYITDSKGNNIDADDVIFSIEMSRDKAEMTAFSTYLESLVKTGDYSLRMVINTTLPGMFESMIGGQTLYIVDQEWYENASAEERQQDPAVTGAYKVVEMTSGSSVTLEAIDDYWQTDESLLPSVAQTNVKTIEFKVITEGSMRTIALENGEVDLSLIQASDLGHFYADNASLDGWNVMSLAGTMPWVCFLNMDSGESIFADNLELRQAALYALNSEDLLIGAGYNTMTASVIKTLAAPAMAGYVEQWSTEDYYDYDVEKAKECLAAAGYEPGEVTIRMLTSNAIQTDAFRAVAIANLEAAGFKVESVSVDQALFNTYKNDSSQWDIIFDMRQATGGHVAGLFDSLFNPVGYSNGGVCFTHDDELLRLLEDVDTVADDASLIAFNDYLKANAIGKGLYVANTLYVAQDGVLSMPFLYGVFAGPNAASYSVDYQHAEK